MNWVQIRPGLSWHSVLTPTRMFDTYRTRCGRTVVTKDTRDELPAEKSCEVCARILIWNAENEASENNPSPLVDA